MATNKNFEVKNGLSVGGTERISSAGAFTGSLASGVTATTQSAADNSTKIATTAYTDAAITAVIGGAPGTLDTLNELAAAINDDASYATTLTTALATKLPLAGGSLTGALNTTGRVNLTDDNSISESYVQLGITNTVSSAGLFLHANSGSGKKYEIQSTADGKLIVYDRTSGAYRLELLANGDLTMAGNIDTAGLLKVGGNDSEYANNYIRFKPTGAAYIDHNTVGQDINFRTSASSSLDRTPLVVQSGGILVTGSVNVSSNVIQANGNQHVIGVWGTSGLQLIGQTGADNIVGTMGANEPLVFRTGSTERMRISSTGILEVQHDAYDGMQRSLTLSNPRNAAGTGDGTSIYFNNTGTSTIARSAYIGSVSEENYGQSNVLVFGTSSGGNAPTEVMRIDSSGNVGIGTDDPLAKLHVTDGPVVVSPGTSSHNGAYHIIGSVANFNTGNGRYMHAQLSTTVNMMFHIIMEGYTYTIGQRYGRCSGYVYNYAAGTNGATGAFGGPGVYDGRISGNIVAMHTNQNNPRIEVVIDTGNTGTSNRWGSYSLVGGTDHITAYIGIEVVQYTTSSTGTRQFTS
jgi:roadblock/LC7 domain-containing protein